MKHSDDSQRYSARKRLTCSFVLVLLFCLALMLFYAITPAPLVLGDSIRYFGLVNGHESDGELKITEDSDHYRKLQDWLRKRRIWYPDINSYVDVDRMLSDRIDINVMEDRVVVNVFGGSRLKWSQYSCAVDDEIRGLVSRLHASLEDKLNQDANTELK